MTLCPFQQDWEYEGYLSLEEKEARDLGLDTVRDGLVHIRLLKEDLMDLLE